MPLIALRAEGTRDAIFCMHPTGGHINEYVALSQLLDDPVYAIESRACRGAGIEHASIEAMAHDYADLVQATRPGTPTRLVGWSMGAVIAHAVACELERRGETVELVGMADPRLESGADLDDVRIATAMAIQIFNPVPPPRRTLSRELDTLDAHADVESLFDWCEARALLPREVRPAELVATIRLVPVHRALVAAHVPGRCRAPLVVWTGDARFERRSHDWRTHTSGTVRETAVGGTHFTIMRSPQVNAIADELRAVTSSITLRRDDGADT